jgi:DNA-binding transcriptional LysR family regulator
MYEGPEFRHLRYFLAVAEECNFSRAAQRLNVSQPSLSAQIKQLEDGLRAHLFMRGRAGAALTHAGRAFLPFAKQMLQIREYAVSTAFSVHSGVGLALRFGYSPFVDHRLVGEALKAYRELVPDSVIEPSSECTAPLITMVLEGRLDAALVSMPVSEKDLFVHRICTERLLICLRRDDPLAAMESIPKEAVAERLRILVARPHHPLFYEDLMRRFGRAKIHPHLTDFVSAPAEMQFLVKMGVGWGVVRESTPIDPELTTRSIDALPLRIKTAFICHRAQQRPVLPLLAYQLAKVASDLGPMSMHKPMNDGAGHGVAGHLQVFGRVLRRAFGVTNDPLCDTIIPPYRPCVR